MKIFDGHADIWFDVSAKRKNGEECIVKNHHLKRFRDGNIMGGIFIAYLDENAVDEEKEMMWMINSTIHEIKKNEELYNIIKNSGDFNKGIINEKLNVLMGIEGLRAIKKNLDWLDTFYQLGFRHASLTWNEENDLGTGAKGNENRGITETGKAAIKKMNELGMIVDVSHANEKTFWDIYEVSDKPIIASHSNARKLCDHVRNLTDEQIKAIAESGGLVGAVAYKGFVDLEKEKQTIERYVDHIDYIVSLAGIKHVGLGFDFCEYLYAGRTGKDMNPKDLEDASYAQNVIEELRKREYSEEDIRKIAYENFMRVIEINFEK
ncbi:dipeptidase [Fusobacterium varium]